MPLPGDNTFGRRKGSYSPTDDNLDSTPFKPVPLAFQQADGTMPMEIIDRNANKGPPPPTHRQADNRNRRKCIIAAVIIAVIILLIIILTLSICLGTDMCSSSSSSSSSSGDSSGYAHRAQLRGQLAAPVLVDSGLPPFDEHLNNTLRSGNTTASSNNEALSTDVTPSRRKRQSDNGDHRQHADNEADHTDQSMPLSNRYSSIEHYLMDNINGPLLHALKDSEMCRRFDCESLSFENMRLDIDKRSGKEVLATQFNVSIGSNEPMDVGPQMVHEAVTSTARNFSRAFNFVFPGYRLDAVALSFDSEEFCGFESVRCYNFTGFVDVFCTSAAGTTTSTITDTEDYDESETTDGTTVADRSELLPPIMQIFSTDGTTKMHRSERIADANTTRSTATTTSSTSTSKTTRSASRVPAGGSGIGPASVSRGPTGPTGMADCSQYGYLCTNQVDRISWRSQCDGIVQCPDGSDEKLCKQCHTSFSCPKGDGYWLCRRGKILCDGRSECPTQHDESAMYCKSTCLSSEYNCRGSQICIPRRWMCDGDVHCPQGDDEEDCKEKTKCNKHAFFCPADRRCIGSWAECNGIRDCSDGADEESCSCVDCAGNSTALCTAPFGRCIQSRQVCDGKQDCPNGEDEQNCR